MIDGPRYFKTLAAIDGIVNGAMPEMMPLAKRLWPICRSITGPGVRETLDILSDVMPLQRHRVSSGSQCFDWTVPPEWTIRAAHIKGPDGRVLVNFKDNNLHVVSYSEPIDKRMNLAELEPHLHSLKDYPEAIPYVASYYKRTWGFCISEEQHRSLFSSEGPYDVYIDSDLDEKGGLDYGQGVIEGSCNQEILFSTYICHPSMANNELSGPLITANIMSLLARVPDLQYTYRCLFSTETIGTICFLSEHFEELSPRIVAGYVVSCVGDDGPYNYVRSMREDCLAGHAAEHVLRHLAPIIHDSHRI